jgi:mRNA interferase HicA
MGKPMKQHELKRHLSRHGCALHHEGGHHEIWVNLATLKRAPVPRHTECKNGTVRGICKQLGIPDPFKSG